MGGETTPDGLIEVEGAPRRLITGTTDSEDGVAPGQPPARRRHGFTVSGIDPSLATALKRPMTGDERTILEDVDLVGQDVNVEDATAGGVWHAVEIATDARPSLRGRRAARA